MILDALGDNSLPGLISSQVKGDKTTKLHEKSSHMVVEDFAKEKYHSSVLYSF